MHQVTALTSRLVDAPLAYRRNVTACVAARRHSVNEAPTSFGPLTYSLRREGNRLTGNVLVPSSRPPATLRLRLRLPHGVELSAVRVNGQRRAVERRTATIDLSGLSGSLDVTALLSR